MSEPTFKTRREDRDAVAAALLRSYDFMELGFSARRPLGTSSTIARDVLSVLGEDYEVASENRRLYAAQVWSEMRAHLPEFIERVFIDHEKLI